MFLVFVGLGLIGLVFVAFYLLGVRGRGWGGLLTPTYHGLSVEVRRQLSGVEFYYSYYLLLLVPGMTFRGLFNKH